MEFLILRHEHICRDGQRGEFRRRDRQPDALDAESSRQGQHEKELEPHGAQKGDERTGHAVAQSGEEGGTVHVEAHDEEAQAVHPEGVAGEGQQLRVVAHNGIARVVQSYFCDMTNEEYAAFGIQNCELRKFDF